MDFLLLLFEGVGDLVATLVLFPDRANWRI